ncbi:MAG: response regulator, partial [Gammaproteobacteria bacterium]|nr:response regulator [Gammaproteobacteria bacterium]
MSDQESTKQETLVVDDSSTILATAKKMLEDEFIVNTASDGAEAWEIVNKNENIKIIFTDMQMPVMNGMQLLLKVRESDDKRIAKIPVIMITGQSDSPAGKKAVFDIGATDFIGKPFDAMDLLSRARSNTEPQRRSSDKLAISSPDVFITPSGFQNIGREALAKALETKEEFTVVNIEFVNINEVKESVGDKSSRQIIVTMVRRIAEVMRERDVATRIGENRFAVILYTDEYNAKLAVERLCEYMKKLIFELKGKTLRIELAYGYSSVNCYDRDVQFGDICTQADTALKEAVKIKLGNQIAEFKGQDGSEVVEKSQTNTVDLWPALTNIVDGDFHLVKDEQIDDLIRCMTAFLDYAKEKK